jgi:rhodanese-related sulfurtransferase
MQEISVSQLKEWLQGPAENPLVLDVREPWEITLCRIEPSVAIPMREISARLAELDPDGEIAVLCHHGVRSRFVAQFLDSQGFKRVYNVTGGIDRWAREQDPAMQTY